MSGNKVVVDNPLYGYKIKSIKSSSRRTEIVVIKGDMYRKYAAPGSPYNELSEKALKDAIESDFGLMDVSMRQKG